MIQKVNEWWQKRKAKNTLDELLKQSRESLLKTRRVETDTTLFAVYLDRLSTGGSTKRFEANLYGGINGAWRIGSGIIFLPVYETDVFDRKATEVYWRRFFSGLATRYNLHIFLPRGNGRLEGVWYYSDGNDESIKAPDSASAWRMAGSSANHVSRVVFCEPQALKDPSRLSELARQNTRLVVLYTSEIPRDLEIFAGGRSLQFDLFFLIISPLRVYVTGPSIWGADRPYFNKDFYLQREAELFSCHIPLGFPEFGYEREVT